MDMRKNGPSEELASARPASSVAAQALQLAPAKAKNRDGEKQFAPAFPMTSCNVYDTFAPCACPAEKLRPMRPTGRLGNGSFFSR
jgi:hypothetical protein